MNAKKILQILFLCLITSAISSCRVQTLNSVNGDAAEFGALPNSSKAFLKVRAIIRTSCAQCHSNFAGYSESDFVSHKMIVPRKPTQSMFYKKLKGAGGDMPQNAPPLSEVDMAAIRAWIKNATSTGNPAPTTPFGKAQLVIEDSCISCHKDLNGFSESDFVKKGWVIPGNANDSRLYYKLIGSNVSGHSGPDMPLKGDPLDGDQLQTLRAWINQLNPASMPEPALPPNTAFGRVQQIMGDSCFHCHSEYATYTETDFVKKHLVIPGDAASSPFYNSLVGSLPLSSESSMPAPKKGAAPLTEDQIHDVSQWIAQLQVPPTPLQLAVIKIRADFQQNIKPLVKRGCMSCHDSHAKPEGLLGDLPFFRQIEWKHIKAASQKLDFSLSYPNWSAGSSDPFFYLNEIKGDLEDGSMPPGNYKFFHKHDGKVLNTTEVQTVLNWIAQSTEALQAADTSKPTASRFFTQKCLGCHNSGAESGGLAFEENGDLLAVPTGKTKNGIPFITQLNPENSAIYLVLLTDPAHRKGLKQMPEKNSVTDVERQFIYDWIKQGSPSN